jgi:hypothetical protein
VRISPSTEHFFPHPIYHLKGRSPGTLIVPDYFFKAGATFDRFGDPDEKKEERDHGGESTSYYAFPNFALLLFRYAKGRVEGGIKENMRLTQYLKREGQKCYVKLGIPDKGEIKPPPHPLLKRHWRWNDVLWALWMWRHKLERPPDRFTKEVDYCSNSEAIVDYIDSFGTLGEKWFRKHWLDLRLRGVV